MATQVVLHIGLMKSGTTYVQRRLAANAKELAAEGVLFPTPWVRQVSGVSDVLRRQVVHTDVDGSWDDLVKEIQDHPGSAVLSMEFLGPGRRADLARLVESLGDVDIRVVATLRDLGRNVPAMWQESLKNGDTGTWRDFVRGLKGRETPASRSFWRHQGVVRIVRHWADVVGAERMRLVTVPPKGADRRLLWDRVREACDLPAIDYRKGASGNESLGAASAALLRRLNGSVGGGALPWQGYQGVVKQHLAKRVLPRHTAEEQPIGFRPPRWLRERAAQQRADLAASGVPVIGDLADLDPATVPGVDPDKVSEAEVNEVAVWLLGQLVHERVGTVPTPG